VRKQTDDQRRHRGEKDPQHPRRILAAAFDYPHVGQHNDDGEDQRHFAEDG